MALRSLVDDDGLCHLRRSGVVRISSLIRRNNNGSCSGEVSAFLADRSQPAKNTECDRQIRCRRCRKRDRSNAIRHWRSGRCKRDGLRSLVDDDALRHLEVAAV